MNIPLKILVIATGIVAVMLVGMSVPPAQAGNGFAAGQRTDTTQWPISLRCTWTRPGP